MTAWQSHACTKLPWRQVSYLPKHFVITAPPIQAIDAPPIFNDRNVWVQCYVKNRNNYEGDGSEDVLCIWYNIFCGGTATNF